MTFLAALPAPVPLAAASSKTTTSGGSTEFLIFLVLIAVVAYFLLLRPQRQKARRQQSLQSDIAVGDEILTIGGIVGTVLSIDAERVTIVTGLDSGEPDEPAHPPHRMVLLRSAIARKLEPVIPPQDDGIVDTDLGEDGHWDGDTYGNEYDEYDEYDEDTADDEDEPSTFAAAGRGDDGDAPDRDTRDLDVGDLDAGDLDAGGEEGVAEGGSSGSGRQGRTEGGSREGRSP